MSEPTTARRDYEALRFGRWAVYDALAAAAHVASRAADCFEGQEGCLVFGQLRDAIANFREYSPEMKAVKDLMYAARENLNEQE